MQRIKVSFDTWIQLLGMLGVTGGLIFLGLGIDGYKQVKVCPGEDSNL